MSKQPEVMWIHAVRTLSVFSVVVLHSAAEVFFLNAPFNSYEWWVGNVYDSAVRFCVPLLFMITGFLMLDKQEPASVFLKKRVRKVLIPLIVWSAFFWLWGTRYEINTPAGISMMTPDLFQQIKSAGLAALVVFLICPVYYHLWFLYALLGLYLLMPLLQVLVRNASRSLLWYMLGLWLVATTLLPVLVRLTKIQSILELQMVTGYIGYLVLGFVLGHIPLTSRRFLAAIGVALVSLVATIFGTYFLTAADGGKLNQDVWGLSPNVVVLSASVFIVLRYLGERSRLLQGGAAAAAVRALSAASFGIYLIHVVFMHLFAVKVLGFKLTALSGDPIYFVPLLALTVYGSSLLVISLMRKVPLLRASVP